MDFVRAKDVAEAIAAKAERPDAEFLAGGTDLMVAVNLDDHRPQSVIGLRHVAELQQMDGTRIGAGVTWDRLERAPQRALAQAARTVGSPQIRAAGTIGGNVGTASPAGDGLAWIAALDAGIEVASLERGRRIVPWAEFFVGVKRTSLAADEMITAVVLPDEEIEAQEFAKVGSRNTMVISTVSCVVARVGSGYRVALGSVAPTPMRAFRAEEMLNDETSPSPAAIAEFGRLVAAEVRPITDHRSTEAYRRHAAGVLAGRLLERCLSS
ncbi:MAG: FAD binding domain-containing protein [Acidobacteria bacterium]|nr:FAD binding domain-containing protein [Acidobacteriota bacterium]